MFIRYSITAEAEEVARRFSVDVPDGYQPNFNAAPTHLLPVITQDSQRGISFFYWGAPPSWAKKKALAEKIVNIRFEAIAEKLVLRKKLLEKRCLIPADGFYDWKKTGKKTSIPYRFTRKDKGLFSIAGLWEEYDDDEGNMFHTFSVITRPAVVSVLPICDRMPVLLTQDDEATWLNTQDITTLLSQLEAFREDLEYYSVSSMVNSPDRNSKLVILPAPPADQYGNLSLFD